MTRRNRLVQIIQKLSAQEGAMQPSASEWLAVQSSEFLGAEDAPANHPVVLQLQEWRRLEQIARSLELRLKEREDNFFRGLVDNPTPEEREEVLLARRRANNQLEEILIAMDQRKHGLGKG